MFSWLEIMINWQLTILKKCNQLEKTTLKYLLNGSAIQQRDNIFLYSLKYVGAWE